MMKHIVAFAGALGVAIATSSAFGQADVSTRVEQACGADVEKFCAGVKRAEGGILSCLAANYSDLSPSCREAFDIARDDQLLFEDARPNDSERLRVR